VTGAYSEIGFVVAIVGEPGSDSDEVDDASESVSSMTMVVELGVAVAGACVITFFLDFCLGLPELVRPLARWPVLRGILNHQRSTVTDEE
jgi:hypothetical protein